MVKQMIDHYAGVTEVTIMSEMVRSVREARSKYREALEKEKKEAEKSEKEKQEPFRQQRRGRQKLSPRRPGRRRKLIWNRKYIQAKNILLSKKILGEMLPRKP